MAADPVAGPVTRAAAAAAVVAAASVGPLPRGGRGVKRVVPANFRKYIPLFYIFPFTDL